MQMESSSSPRKFRFRDHTFPESQNSIQSSEPSSEAVSAASLPITEPDAKLDIESMTGRGIKHLCDELQELKEAATQDLQKNICANYSSFLSILEEVTGIENELLQLENHFLSHERLVKDLIGSIYPKILSITSTIEEESLDVVPSPPSELEAHIDEFSEKLDILMLENKISEALNLLESADQHYQSIQLHDQDQDQDHFHSDDEIMLYNTVISAKKSMLKQHLRQIAENKRIAGPELQSALASLCRLGDSQLAIQLLLKYYHLRIVTETNNLQWSKSSQNEMYIKELARFVFSMISQAARSFVVLCGETSPYTSELIMWAYEETKSFITCFDKFVKSTSAVSVGLSSSIKAVKYAVLYCSSLENQKLELRSYMVKHIYPCMEEVFNTHINHFKKVIAFFSSCDPWILEKYLVSGVFDGDGSSTLAVAEQPDYCLLTSSGRKVLTLLQTIVEDISPLIALGMGSLVISGLTNLFTEYIVILERSLTYETNAMEQDSSRFKFAESLTQQVSILANLSTLVQFLSSIVKSIFNSNVHMDSQIIEKNHSSVHQKKDVDDFTLFIEEESNKLRNVFCQQLILKVLSIYNSHEIFSYIHRNDQFDANSIHNPMPSPIFQVLFLELRKIEKLEEENVFELKWLMGFLKELMVSMFIWVSKNKEINTTTEEHDAKQQFILDVQFLVEIGMYGGYFSNDPLLLLTLMKSTFNSAGLDPFKDSDSDDWAIDVATKTIQKLLEIEKTSLYPKEATIKEELDEHEKQITQSAYECNVDAEEHEAEVVVYAETASSESDTAFSSAEGSLVERDYVDTTDTLNLRQPSISNSNVLLENSVEKAADVRTDELSPISSVGEEVEQNSEKFESKS